MSRFVAVKNEFNREAYLDADEILFIDTALHPQDNVSLTRFILKVIFKSGPWVFVDEPMEEFLNRINK